MLTRKDSMDPTKIDVNSIPWKSNEEFYKETGLDPGCFYNWDAHVDRLIGIAKSIELHKLTVLTGSNASGKSVVRKLMNQAIPMKLSMGPDTQRCVAALSFMTRAGLDSYRGCNFMRDSEWSATSENSVRLAKSLLKTDTGRYLILDEPEIGMAEEMQLALAQYINSVKEDVLKNSYGLMVITHSRIIVKELHDDVFVNIDNAGWNKEDWLNREIVPTDLDKFTERSSRLFEAIRKRETH